MDWRWIIIALKLKIEIKIPVYMKVPVCMMLSELLLIESGVSVELFLLASVLVFQQLLLIFWCSCSTSVLLVVLFQCTLCVGCLQMCSFDRVHLFLQLYTDVYQSACFISLTMSMLDNIKGSKACRLTPTFLLDLVPHFHHAHQLEKKEKYRAFHSVQQQRMK